MWCPPISFMISRASRSVLTSHERGGGERGQLGFLLQSAIVPFIVIVPENLFNSDLFFCLLKNCHTPRLIEVPSFLSFYILLLITTQQEHAG